MDSVPISHSEPSGRPNTRTATAGEPTVSPATPSPMMEVNVPSRLLRLLTAHTSFPGAVSIGPHASSVTASPGWKKPLDSDTHSLRSPTGEMKKTGVLADDLGVAKRWLFRFPQVATSSWTPARYLARGTSRHSLVSYAGLIVPSRSMSHRFPCAALSGWTTTPAPGLRAPPASITSPLVFA
jgi:hypothetical protein